MDENTLIFVIVIAGWMALLALDLVALISLRRRHLPPAATVLWVIWIVLAPVIGVATYFFMRPGHMAAQPATSGEKISGDSVKPGEP